MIDAKVIEDSITQDRDRITTLELQYPRFIHSEVLTHRAFSRNAMSSRAVPVAKMIEQVRNNPARPLKFMLNEPGMQSNQEGDALWQIYCENLWAEAAEAAAGYAERMVHFNVHKQFANRLLEPFQWMRTIVTATAWDNFFDLRCHPDAQPEFRALAELMRKRMDESNPVRRDFAGRGEQAWHLPYVEDAERSMLRLDVLLKISTARCARVSYLTHDGQAPSVGKDLALYGRLVGSVPRHSSPAEHQARVGLDDCVSNNFRGWLQHRAYIDGGDTPC